MDIAVLKRALEREKARRLKAEELLESKSRELYLSYEKLQESHAQLESINKDLQEQQRLLLDKQEQFLNLNTIHESVTNDLRVAANLQEQLLPDTKRYGEYEMRGLCKPAMYVAGDVYDYFRLSDSVMAFYMADVTGHGPAAAMISYSIHKQLNPTSEGVCIKHFRSSETLADAVCSTVSTLNNEYAALQGHSHYFTLIYGLLNLDTAEVCFVQAGHPAPLHLSKQQSTVEEIGSGGFPVGMFKDLQYTSYQCTLNVGDSFFLYSDGITECFSPSNEEYGRQRLVNLLKETRDEKLSAVLHAVEESTTAWNDSTEFSDDVSIIAIQRH